MKLHVPLRLRAALLACMAALTGIAAGHAADSISINFTTGSGGTYSISDGNTAGLYLLEDGTAVSGANWNQFSGNNGSNVLSVYDGTALEESAAKITWSSKNSWQGDLSNLSTGDAQMLKGYLDDGSGVNINVSGMDFLVYDVYIYANTDTAGVDYSAKTVNGTTYTYDADGNLVEGTAAWGDSGTKNAQSETDLETNAVLGTNAMLVEGQSGLLTIQSSNSGGNRGCIAGIQIVDSTANYLWTSTAEGEITADALSTLLFANGDVTKTLDQLSLEGAPLLGFTGGANGTNVTFADGTQIKAVQATSGEVSVGGANLDIGTLFAKQDATLTFTGTLSNDALFIGGWGDVVLDADLSLTDLTLDGGLNVGAGKNVTVSGSFTHNNMTISGGEGSRLTLSAAGDMAYAGSFGGYVTVDYAGGGTFTLGSGDKATALSPNASADATLQISNGGTLSLYSGKVKWDNKIIMGEETTLNVQDGPSVTGSGSYNVASFNSDGFELAGGVTFMGGGRLTTPWGKNVMFTGRVVAEEGFTIAAIANSSGADSSQEYTYYSLKNDSVAEGEANLIGGTIAIERRFASLGFTGAAALGNAAVTTTLDNQSVVYLGAGDMQTVNNVMSGAGKFRAESGWVHLADATQSLSAYIISSGATLSKAGNAAVTLAGGTLDASAAGVTTTVTSLSGNGYISATAGNLDFSGKEIGADIGIKVNGAGYIENLTVNGSTLLYAAQVEGESTVLSGVTLTSGKIDFEQEALDAIRANAAGCVNFTDTFSFGLGVNLSSGFSFTDATASSLNELNGVTYVIGESGVNFSANAQDITWDAVHGDNVPAAGVAYQVTSATASLMDSAFSRQEGYGIVNVVTGTNGQTGVQIAGGSIKGDNSATLLDSDIWTNVTGGDFRLVIGGSNANNWGGGDPWSITGDVHTQLEGDAAVDYLVGGIYKDGKSPVLDGNVYVSVSGNAVIRGSLIGGGTTAHTKLNKITGNVHVVVNNVQSQNTASALNQLINGYIIGGSAFESNQNAKTEIGGNTRVDINLADDSSGNFVKGIVGGSYAAPCSSWGNGSNSYLIGGDTSVNIVAPTAVVFTGDVIGGSFAKSNAPSTINGNAYVNIDGGSYSGNLIAGSKGAQSVLNGNATMSVKNASFLSGATLSVGDGTINGVSTLNLGGEGGSVSLSDTQITGFDVVNLTQAATYSGNMALNDVGSLALISANGNGVSLDGTLQLLTGGAAVESGTLSLDLSRFETLTADTVVLSSAGLSNIAAVNVTFAKGVGGSISIDGNNLVYTACDTLTWAGGATGTWTADAVWNTGAEDVTYPTEGDVYMLLSDVADLTDSAITVEGAVTPTRITVDNAATAYELTGAGSLSNTVLNKTGSGDLLLSGTLSLTGTQVNIEEGAVILTSVNALRTGDFNIAQSATLALKVDSGTVTSEFNADNVPALSGNGTIEKTGSGIWQLKGNVANVDNSAFTGDIVVSGGTLRLGQEGTGGIGTNSIFNPAILGNGEIIVKNGAVLEFSFAQNNTVANAFEISNDITLEGGAALAQRDGRYKLTGNVTLTGNATIKTNYGKDVILTQALNAAGQTLTHANDGNSGGGVLDINGANSSIGQLINNDGTVNFNTDQLTLGSAAISGGLVQFATGVYDNVGDITLTSGAVGALDKNSAATFKNTITLKDGSTDRVSFSALDSAVGMTLANVVINKGKYGNGSVDLRPISTSGEHLTPTVTGAHMDVSGVYTFTNVVFADSAFTIREGGELTFGHDAELLSLNGGGLAKLTSYSVSVGEGDFSGIISGSGSLTKTGAGELILSGVNTYSGATNVKDGILRLSGAGALGAGNIVLGETSAVARSSTVITEGKLVFDNTEDVTVNNDISGVGTLEKLGDNTLTLGGNNTYVGITSILAGAIELASAGALADGTVTLSNPGSLIFNYATAGDAHGNDFTGDGAIVFKGAADVNLTGMVADTLTLTLSPGADMVMNLFLNPTADMLTATDYTDIVIGSAFNGNIVKNDAGTLNLNGSHAYAGTTTINAGVVNVLGANALGAGQVIMNEGVSLVFDYAESGTPYGSDFTGSGMIVFKGAADINLTGTVADTLVLSFETTDTQTMNLFLNAGTDFAALTENTDIVLANPFTGAIRNDGSGVLNIDKASGTLNLHAADNSTTHLNSVSGNFVLNGTGLGTIHINDMAGGSLKINRPNSLTASTYVNGGTFTKLDAHDGLIYLTGDIDVSGDMVGGNSSSAVIHIGTEDGLTAAVTAQNFYGHFEHASANANENKTEITVHGGSTLTINNMLQPARDGKGILTIEDGATVLAHQLDMGTANGWTGGSASKKATLNLNDGGSLYIGSGGITQHYNSDQSPGEINLGSGEGGAVTLGIKDGSGWASALNMNLNSEVIVDTVAQENGAVGTITLNGILSGEGSLTKIGEGALALTAANTYVGGTVIKEGSVRLDDNGQLGSGAVTLGGTTVGDDGEAVETAGKLVLNQSEDATLSNNISGAGSLEKTGAGTVTLSGNNSFTGGVTIDAGTLKMGSANSLGAFNYNAENAAAITVNAGATLDINGAKDTEYVITLNGGALVNNGSDIGNTNKNFPRLILTADSEIGGTGDWHMLGPGYAQTSVELGGYTLTKTGDNTVYFNNTAVTQGALDVQAGSIHLTGNRGELSAVAVNMAADTTLDISGLDADSASVGTLTGDGKVTLGSKTLILNGGSFGGTISGGAGSGIILAENGTLQLTGSNMHSFGQATVSAGATLELANMNAKLQDGTDISLASGSTLIVNSGTATNTLDITVNSAGGDYAVIMGSKFGNDAVLDGTITGNGELYITNSPRESGILYGNALTIDSDITDGADGALTLIINKAPGRDGDGLYLGGNNDYSGGTIIEEGKVTVTSSSGLGTGNVELRDGSLYLTASDALNGEKFQMSANANLYVRAEHAVSGELNIARGTVHVDTQSAINGNVTMTGGNFNLNALNGITGSFDFQQGTVYANVTGSADVLGADVVSVGANQTLHLNADQALTKQLAVTGGTVHADVANSYTGTIDVGSGTFYANADYAMDGVMNVTGGEVWALADYSIQGQLNISGGLVWAEAGNHDTQEGSISANILLTGGILHPRANDAITGHIIIDGGKLNGDMRNDQGEATYVGMMNDITLYNGNIHDVYALSPFSTIIIDVTRENSVATLDGAQLYVNELTLKTGNLVTLTSDRALSYLAMYGLQDKETLDMISDSVITAYVTDYDTALVQARESSLVILSALDKFELHLAEGMLFTGTETFNIFDMSDGTAYMYNASKDWNDIVTVYDADGNILTNWDSVDMDTTTGDITFSLAIPEPGSVSLGALGLAGLLLRRRREKAAK